MFVINIFKVSFDKLLSQFYSIIISLNSKVNKSYKCRTLFHVRYSEIQKNFNLSKLLLLATVCQLIKNYITILSQLN